MSCECQFLVSKQCGKIVEVIHDTKEPCVCCGDTMEVMTANTSEGAAEKHLPVVERNGRNITVKVGSIFHPMSEEHSIGWVYLQTKKGSQRKNLLPTEEPVAYFTVTEDDEPVAAYAYCNLHGFWKTEI